MFIAHLPAGYLLTRRIAAGSGNRRGLMAAGLAASVLPDLDLIWFYLVDNRQSVHHAYLFHWPLFWIALAGLTLGAARLARIRGAGPYVGVALAALLLHMVLDSIAAGIAWLAPFSDFEINLIEVPARHGWWVWNFVLHWTFGLELAILAAAGAALWRDTRRPDPARATHPARGAGPLGAP